MVASKASPKASGPGKALGVLATELDAQEHEALEPQAGLLKGDFCHQPRDLLCGPMGDAFYLVRQAGSNALVFFQNQVGVVSNCSICSTPASWMAQK